MLISEEKNVVHLLSHVTHYVVKITYSITDAMDYVAITCMIYNTYSLPVTLLDLVEGKVFCISSK